MSRTDRRSGCERAARSLPAVPRAPLLRPVIRKVKMITSSRAFIGQTSNASSSSARSQSSSGLTGITGNSRARAGLRRNPPLPSTGRSRSVPGRRRRSAAPESRHASSSRLERARCDLEIPPPTRARKPSSRSPETDLVELALARPGDEPIQLRGPAFDRPRSPPYADAGTRKTPRRPRSLRRSRGTRGRGRSRTSCPHGRALPAALPRRARRGRAA